MRLLALSPKAVRRMEAVNAQGAVRFIMLRGVLGFGGILAALFAITSYFEVLKLQVIIQQAFPGARDPARGFFARTIFVGVFVSLAAGLVWGVLVWFTQRWLLRHARNHNGV